MVATCSLTSVAEFIAYVMKRSFRSKMFLGNSMIFYSDYEILDILPMHLDTSWPDPSCLPGSVKFLVETVIWLAFYNAGPCSNQMLTYVLSKAVWVKENRMRQVWPGDLR